MATVPTQQTKRGWPTTHQFPAREPTIPLPALSFGRLGMLRPVGELVPPMTVSSKSFPWPAGYSACWVNSGTTALALAVKTAIERHGGASRRVAIPGYACPDLVAAILWAGAQPVAVDTLERSPWIDSRVIKSKPTGYFAAAVAPHFQGIAHPLESLSQTCVERDIILIEDAAQSNVCSKSFSPEADLVVLSFGRGKPIPVGGGVLLHKDHWSDSIGRATSALPLESASIAGWRLRVMIQNAAMTRPGYALARSLPHLAVGQTVYKPLLTPARTPPAVIRARESALAQWNVSALPVQHAIASALRHAQTVQAATYDLGWDGSAPLLRFPTLVTGRTRRERLLSNLRIAGIEATALYGVTIDKTARTPAIEVTGQLANAAAFASQLLTLPAHSDVRDADIAAMQRCLT